MVQAHRVERNKNVFVGTLASASLVRLVVFISRVCEMDAFGNPGNLD